MRDETAGGPRLAPPGQRSGEGSASVLPYLLMSLASKAAPALPDVLRRRVAPDPGAARSGQRH